MSDALRELEAALATTFSLDNLQVYGDYLMGLGDPRGELVAVDVHEARLGASPDVEHRRRRALRAWLGLAADIDPTRGAWETVRFAYGFVDDVRIDFASRILGSPAGPFVRGLTLTNKVASIEHALVALARAPRPWLSRLTIAPRFRGEPPGRTWRGEAPNLANTVIPAMIAATPRLERLELAGHRLLRDFPHPHLRDLRIEGIDALLSVLEPRDPLPAVSDLALAFARAPGARVLLGRPWPALLPAASFPAVRRLDLSGNEAQRATTDTQVGVFDVLPTLGVLEQLVELRLPSIRNGLEAAFVQRAIDRMPELRRLEVIRGWGKHAVHRDGVEIVEVGLPWPRFEAPIASESVWVRFPGDRVAYELPIETAIRFCDRSFDDFDTAARECWIAWWQLIEHLPEGSAAHRFEATTLRRALDAVGYLDGSRSEIRPWARLREHVHEAGDVDIFVGRRRPPA